MDPTKRYTCPRAKEKSQQVGRRDEITFKMKPIPIRNAGRAQTKPCAHQDPETPQRLSQTCLCVAGCLLQRHRGPAVASGGDRGSGCSRTGRRGMWHKSS